MPITISIQAQTPEDLLRMLADTAQVLNPSTQDKPTAGPKQAKAQAPAAAAVEATVCPDHGKAKAGRDWLYCPTRLDDGSWCTWQGKKATK